MRPFRRPLPSPAGRSTGTAPAEIHRRTLRSYACPGGRPYRRGM